MDHTLWIHQIYVICAASEMPQAIGALDIAFPCDDGLARDSSKPENYASKLSSNGNEPATHYGAAFVVTEEIRLNLEDLGLAQTPGITYWRCSNPEGVLETTNHLASEPNVGSNWEWKDCLDALGLVNVNNAIENKKNV